MPLENPLDYIKKMNAENAAKKLQEQEEAAQQETRNQENTDKRYELKSKEKEDLTESVEAFKQRIYEIKGTQEEMIAQYRETINEAKKDPATLQYVRDNFDEIFNAKKEEWRAIGSEKAEDIASMNSDQEKADQLSDEMEKIYPETSGGKASIEQEKKERDEEKRVTFKNEFLNIIQSIEYNPEGPVERFPHAKDNPQFLENHNMTEEEYEHMRTEAVEEAVDAYLKENHGKLAVNNEGVVEESHGNSGWSLRVSFDEIEERMRYEENLDTLKDNLDSRLRLFNHEFKHAQQEYEKMYESLSPDVRGMLNGFDMGSFSKRMSRFNPNSIREINERSALDPRTTIDYLDTFNDVVNRIIPSIMEKVKSILEEGSAEGKAYYDMEQEVYHLDEMRELEALTYDHRFSFAEDYDMGKVREKLGKRAPSNEELFKRAREGQAEKESLRQKYIEKLLA